MGPKTISSCAASATTLTAFGNWREQFLAAGADRLSGKVKRTEIDELRRQVSRLEQASGRKTMVVENAGRTLAGLGARVLVARSCEPVAAPGLVLGAGDVGA